MTDDDVDFLQDIVDAARLIATFVAGQDFASFTADEAKYWATAWQVTIIGEATKRLSPECRDSHPTIPWSEMARMRDLMIHHYQKIDAALLWKTATVDVPALLTYLLPLLPADEKQA